MSVQENPQQESIEVQLNRFRKEIAAIKKQEEEKILPTVHLRDVDPYELGVDDMDIWKKVKDDSITSENLEEYINFLMEKPKPLETTETVGPERPPWLKRPVFSKPREGVSESRVKFLHFIRNKAGYIFAEREIEEAKRKNEAKD